MMAASPYSLTVAALSEMDEEARLSLLDGLLTSVDTAILTTRILSNPCLAASIQNSQLSERQGAQEGTQEGLSKAVSIYRCTDCLYGSFTFPELSFHKKTHCNDMQCGLCDYVSTTKEAFTVHHNHHTEALSECCQICIYQTCSTHLLAEHTRLVHEIQYDHRCTSCGYQTTGGQDAIEHHEFSHSGMSDGRNNLKKKNQKADLETRGGTTDTVSDGANILPKSEPVVVEAQVEAADNDPLSEDHESRYLLTIDSVVEGGGDVDILSDRRPWWDTETEILPSMMDALDVPEGCEGRIQCKYCGEFYLTDTATHQCSVIKPKLATSPLTCTLCDYFASNKQEYVEHCISMHSRLWQALIVRLSRSVIVVNIDNLCDVVENYVPRRFKNTADHLQVSYYQNGKLTMSSLYRCTRCYRSFTSIDIQAGHKVFDECHPPMNQSQYSCITCGIEFRTSDEFMTHHLQCHTTLNTVGNDVEPPSSVDKADTEDSRFTEDAMLMIEALQRVGAENTDHVAKESEVSRPSVIKARVVAGDFQMRCQACSFVADRGVNQYMEHVDITHLPDSPILIANSQASMETLNGCSFCAFTCDKPEKLRSHIFSHHTGRRQRARKPKDEKKTTRVKKEGAHAASLPPLLCQSCGFQTTSKSSLKVHIGNHNESKRRFRCEECDFSSVHASGLTIHMRSHTGYRPFVCSMCGKSFITNSELRKHERRHAGLVEKRHSCGICGKNYATPQHLKVHIRRHTGDRPYKCTDCPFAATSKSVLVNHMTTHSGERNYNCHLCSFTCASSGTLSNHRRLKHNIVNKRVTLADTTPESILAAAVVAGRSRKVHSAKTRKLAAYIPTSHTELPAARENSISEGLLLVAPAPHPPSTSNHQLIMPNQPLEVTTLSTNDFTGINPVTNHVAGNNIARQQSVVMPAQCKIIQTSDKHFHVLEAVNINSIATSESNQ